MKKVKSSAGTSKDYPLDETLVKLVQLGKSELALRQFFEKYKTGTSAIQRYIICQGADLADAQDICQEALMQFLKNLGYGRFEVRREGSLLCYLFAIAKNLWLKELRRRRQGLKLLDGGEKWTEIPFAEEEDDIRLVALKTCFDRMDARWRRLLWGYYVEGKGYQALANELDMASWRVACQQAYRKRGELRREVLERISA